MITIGIYLHSDPARLQATLASLAEYAPATRVVLLPDAPDPDRAATLAAPGAYPQLGCTEPRGEAAAFNRLIAADDAPVVVFLESGITLAPGALDRLVAALDAPGVGLAGPSTNNAWNEQRVAGAPWMGAKPADVATFAARLAARYGEAAVLLAPLYSLGDFCYAVKREVIAAIGTADEGYGTGPCWEMDYNIRAARAGFVGVWVQAAYVHRPPYTARRAREESAGFRASRQRYQDKFCGLRLRGDKATYEPHCRGDACPHFAPAALIQVALPRSTPVDPSLPAQPTRPTPAPQEAETPMRPAPARDGAGGEGSPLVSCIMPTRNRRAFVPLAIRSFLQQNYGNAELIVVDDGPDPVADLLPSDPRIRYIRQEGMHTIGAKRNIACAEARGAIIVHWDDDDWYPPDRISRQVRALGDRSADLCGSSQIFYYDPAADRAWRYAYTNRGTPWVAGNTLAYRRAFWRHHPFADIQIGEDARFVWSAPARTLCDLADPALCIGMIHPDNTSRKVTTSVGWYPQAREPLAALLGAALTAYRTVVTGGQDPEALPLITCIMPTRNRRTFLPLALRHFLAQDYPQKELLIVDDGPDPVGDLAEGQPSVTYLWLGTPLSIGAKRNLAVEQARGTIIAHWDDDDWYAPNRLRYQAAPILAGEADLTGLENAYMLALPAGECWTTQAALHRRMFVGNVHGGTLMYRKAVFGAGLRYPEVSLAEDAALLAGAQRRGYRLAGLPNPGVFVYMRHGQNAWRFETGRFLDPAAWCRTALPETFPLELLGLYQAVAAPNAAPALVAEGIGV